MIQPGLHNVRTLLAQHAPEAPHAGWRRHTASHTQSVDPDTQGSEAAAEYSGVRHRDHHMAETPAVHAGEQPVQHRLGATSIQVGDQVENFPATHAGRCSYNRLSHALSLRDFSS